MKTKAKSPIYTSIRLEDYPSFMGPRIAPGLRWRRMLLAESRRAERDWAEKLPGLVCIIKREGE